MYKELGINQTRIPRKKNTDILQKKNTNNSLTRHKYKVESGKKVYTFKNKTDLTKSMGITNKKMEKIINGEVEDKIKISLI